MLGRAPGGWAPIGGAKVALSLGLFGTVAGFQLAAVSESPLVELRFQVALPAKAQFGRTHEQANKIAGRRAKGFTQPFYR